MSVGLLATTPAKEFDATYVVRYAMERDATIVTNEMAYFPSAEWCDEREGAMQRWMWKNQVTFKFHGDKFCPNPPFL